MVRTGWAALILALAAVPFGGAAQNREAALFGARENVAQISLSPNGTKLAMIVPAGNRGTAVLVADTVSGQPPKLVTSSTGDPDRLRSCHWSTDVRLVCLLDVEMDLGEGRLRYSRVVALNADGGDVKMLSSRTTDTAIRVAQDGGSLIDWGADANGSALMTREFVPEVGEGKRLLAEKRRGLAVDLVDTVRVTRKLVEPPNQTAIDYLSDGQGNVRVMLTRPENTLGYDGKRILSFYRTADDRKWRPLGSVTFVDGIASGFSPVAVDPVQNVVYGFEAKDGRAALYTISLDGLLTKHLVLARADVDVDDLIRIGRRNRVVGATYVTDRREAAIFDAELEAVRVSLAKVLPDRLVTIVDASADESRLVLYAGSDVDPGHYYLFDRKARKLAEIVAARPALTGVALARVKAISYRASDGTSIPAYLTLPAGGGARGPAIVMPHGGPGARDEWGFDWLAQYFAARGYAVIQPNFRGSTGFGDAWYQKNGFQSWRTAVGDVNDAGRYLVSQGIGDPEALSIVGWSYGGYAALQSPALDPALFKAIVAIAPVTDLDMLRNEAQGFSNYSQVDAFIGHGPWVREGSPARDAGRIRAPVLLFHGDRDRNVGVGESRLMADRLRNAGRKVEYVEFKGLDHQLDDSAVRAQMLERADAFLRASLKM